jgi:hypothetical protein
MRSFVAVPGTYAERPQVQQLNVLAALLPDGSHAADAWVRADSSAVEASLIDSATPGEWDQAVAVGAVTP